MRITICFQYPVKQTEHGLMYSVYTVVEVKSRCLSLRRRDGSDDDNDDENDDNND